MAGNKLSEYLRGAASKAGPAARRTADYIDADFVDELAKSNKKALGVLGGGAALGAGGYALMDEGTKDEAEQMLKEGVRPKPPEEPPPEAPAAGGTPTTITTKASIPGNPDEGQDKFEAAKVNFKSVASDPIDQAEEYNLLDKDFKTALGKAQDAYERTKDSNASKALWEGIIQGLGHLAAGVYGLRTGLNLGGLKFDKTDWDKKQQAAMLELQQAIDKAKDVRAVKGQKLDRDYQRSLDKMKQNQQLNDQALTVAVNNARLEDAAKERKLRQSIENQRAKTELLQKALSGKDSATVTKIKELEKLEKRLFDLNKAYGKDEESNILDLIKTETRRYKQLSGELGLPAKAYNESDFIDESGWWASSQPEVDVIEQRRRGRLEGGMATVTINGQTGQVPRDKLDEILKKYPDAKIED